MRILAGCRSCGKHLTGRFRELDRDTGKQDFGTSDEKKIIAYKNRLKERNITYIYPGHPYFPEELLNIPDCPRLLYARGRVEELALNRPGIAVVGARKASAYGKEIARSFVSKLASYQTNITAGWLPVLMERRSGQR